MVNVTIALDRGLYRGIKRAGREAGRPWQAMIAEALEEKFPALTVAELDAEDAATRKADLRPRVTVAGEDVTPNEGGSANA